MYVSYLRIYLKINGIKKLYDCRIDYINSYKLWNKFS